MAKKEQQSARTLLELTLEQDILLVNIYQFTVYHFLKIFAVLYHHKGSQKGIRELTHK